MEFLKKYMAEENSGGISQAIPGAIPEATMVNFVNESLEKCVKEHLVEFQKKSLTKIYESIPGRFSK